MSASAPPSPKTLMTQARSAPATFAGFACGEGNDSSAAPSALGGLLRGIVSDEIAKSLPHIREEVERGVGAALSAAGARAVGRCESAGSSADESRAGRERQKSKGGPPIHEWRYRHMRTQAAMALMNDDEQDQSGQEVPDRQEERAGFKEGIHRIVVNPSSTSKDEDTIRSDAPDTKEEVVPGYVLNAWVDDLEKDKEKKKEGAAHANTGLLMNRKWSLMQGVRGGRRSNSSIDLMISIPASASKLKQLVGGVKCETAVCSLIMINTLSLGIQTDLDARYGSDGVPVFLDRLESVFCVLFTIEIILRLATYRLGFFYKRDWAFNIFDLVVIMSDIVVEIMSLFTSSDKPINFVGVRIIRLIRLVRVVRITRVVRHIPELRMLVLSILNSIKSLMWTMMLLALVIYTLSLYFTQIVSERRDFLDEDNDVDNSLLWFYGSMGTTMFTLFMAITGGIDWLDACHPLMERMTPWIAVIFGLYIAVSSLATLNVVTAVFVESVLKSQASDRDWMMVNNARALFESLEGGVHTAMTWDIFESKIDAPEMQDFFKAVNVDPSEARCLFDLLDMDGSGEISAEEFLNGALRFRGPAKALDVALLFREVRQLNSGYSP
eukprot:TRINITY_DN6028_c0_g2_i1.p1 TRINITY_DN6028_c0_g2~~TRINITY_DN6028_c0_g2_i1.p1  ORF type:complete len:609 (-),score=132.14 TRINITY_DN6028_c0_g2_i1:191-2017(-)